MRSYIAEFKMNYFKQKCLDANKKKRQIFCYNKKGKYNVILCNTSVLSDIFYYNVVHALYVSNDYSNFSS